MGASAWVAIAPYTADLTSALRSVQDEALRAEDYKWIYDEDDRPGSVDALWADTFWTEGGTHSVLDMRGMVTDVPDTFATVIPLSDQQVTLLLGSATPGRADFDRVYHASDLDSVIEERWGGSCVTLYADGNPTEIAFWGISGF